MSLSIESLTSEQLASMADLRREVEASTAAHEAAQTAMAAAQERYRALIASFGLNSAAPAPLKGNRQSSVTKLQKINDDAKSKGLLTARQAAELLDVTPSALTAAVSEGRIEVAQRGRAGGYPNLFHPDEIERYRTFRETSPQRVIESRTATMLARGQQSPPAQAPEPQKAAIVEGAPEGWITAAEAADRLGRTVSKFLMDQKMGAFPELPPSVDRKWCPEAIAAIAQREYSTRKRGTNHGQSAQVAA